VAASHGIVRNPAQLLFITAVVLLIALSAWWYVFLVQAVETEHDLLRDKATLSHQLAKRSGHPGVVALDVDAALSSIEKRRERRRFMILGEGILLSGLLFAVVLMLYRLFRSERRFRNEIELFLRRVTHEMKTPIAGIKAVLQTIQMGRMPADQLVDLAGRALAEAEREELLIQNLLLAQRIRQPDAQLKAEPIDLAALVRRLVVGRQQLSSQVEWSVDADDGSRVVGDAGALRTIVDNVLDNAAKYGGGAVQIDVSARPATVVLTVEDNGIGFEDTATSSLFEPFVRQADSRAASRQGTGLGLSISRSLAAKMGGRIEASSPGVGRGATFTLTMPRDGADT